MGLKWTVNRRRPGDLNRSVTRTMEIFFAPVQFFIMHPERIACAAALFFIASLGSSVAERLAAPTAIAGIGWALCSLWELFCKNQGYNIRVDLVLIVPLLFVLTGWGFISLFQPKNAESIDGDGF